MLVRSRRVDPDAKDYSRQTPLWIAAEKGYAEVVEVLVDNDRVDPDAKDTIGRTPLQMAA